MFQSDNHSNICFMTEKRSGIKKIAEVAGVSTATVSRVLNGNSKVNPELSKRVLEVAKDLGYQPSPAARYMRSKKSGLIGIVVPDLSVSYFSDIVNGAIKKAREYEQLVIVGAVEGKTGNEKEYLRKLSGYMLDGLIHCPVSSAPLPDETDFFNIPMVIAGRRKVIEGVPHINTDEENAGYLAARYLLNLGRNRIGYMAGFWESPPFKNYRELIAAIDSPLSGYYSSLDRLHGYRRALEEFGMKTEENKMIFCSFNEDSGYSAAREIFSRLDEIDSLIVPNCIVARGVFRFLHEQGIAVPGDVSVVAMDDMGMGKLLTIPITAIAHDRYNVGVEAVIQLNRIIAGETAGDETIGVKLHIRQSTARRNA